jgi:putative flippase GtrA
MKIDGHSRVPESRSDTGRSARWAPFAVVGLLGFCLQLAALDLLMRAGLAYGAATALAVEATILLNFVLHERWTWRDRRGDGSRGALRRLGRFNAAGVTAIAGNLVLTAAYRELTGCPVLAANALAVLTMTVVNFRVADRWVFRERAEGARTSRTALAER